MLGAQVRVFGFQVGCRTLEEDGQEPRGGVVEVDHHERRHPGEYPLIAPGTKIARTKGSDSNWSVAGHHPALLARQRGTDVKDDPLDQRNVSTPYSSDRVHAARTQI